MPITLLTDLAETKLATAAGSGSQVAITHIALGDASGATYDPAADATALRNERVRRPIDSQVFQGGNTWIVRAEFPTDTPSFAVREIGFFDQDGDLIAIWAGADVEPRQTGVIVYLIEHALSFSRVAEGLIIVDAPPDAEIYPGQMVLAKSGLTFEGYLECDGSLYDGAVYPALAAAGYVTYGPAEVIDLGADGQLIFPVQSGGQIFYFWDRNKDGIANQSGSIDGFTGNEIDAYFNGGADVTEATRSASINGLDVLLPTAQELRDLRDDIGSVPGWSINFYRSSTLTSADNHMIIRVRDGSLTEVSATDANLIEVALIVPDPPEGLTQINALPDSAALGAPTGYSYYIRHGGF